VEKYSELISNGLDLASFLLVTPEILKVIEPTVSRTVAIIIGLAYIGFVTAALVFLLPFVLSRFLSDWFGWPQKWIFPALLIGASIFLGRRLQPWSYETGYNIAYLFGRSGSKILLALGIILFFIARLLAFYSSALKVGWL
jgi:hypothetical protein